MFSSLSFFPWLFIAGILLLVAAILLVFYFQNQHLKNTQHQLAELKEQFALIKTITVSQGKKLLKVSSTVKAIDFKKDLQQQEPVMNKSYQQAAKMLSMGADPEEIMDCCDLTRGEIQLISQLNFSARDNQPYH